MKSLLIAHVEKILLVIVLVVCAWSVYSTYSNPATQSDATMAKVNAIASKVDTAYTKPGYMNFKPTRDFAADIDERFQLEPEAEPLMAWLSGHPTPLGKQVSGDVDTEVFAFELPVPAVLAEDEIGSIRVSVSLPSGDRSNNERDSIKDGLDARWFRQEAGFGDVDNIAKVQAVHVEYSIAGGQWQPFDTAESPNGVAVLNGGRTTDLILNKVEEWTVYQIRARALAVATAVELGAPMQVGREVIVLRDRLDRDATDRPALDELLGQIQAGGKMPRRVALPWEGALPSVLLEGVVGESVEADELLAFLGRPQQQITEVTTRSAIYMGLKRAREGQDENNIPAAATLVLKKLEKDDDGLELGWTPDEEYVVEAGDAVGAEETMNVPWMQFKVPIDLRTPFELQQVQANQDRVWYWEVEVASVMEDGQFKKVLEINPKTKATDVVILRNTKTNNEVPLMEFARITAPRYKTNFFTQNFAPTYPLIPAAGINEEEQFRSAPQDYRIPKLVPTKPELEYDRPALAEVIGSGLSRVADLPYVKMPDGRIYAYLPADNVVYMGVVPGSPYDLHGQAAAAAVPVEVEDGDEEELDQRERRRGEDDDE